MSIAAERDFGLRQGERREHIRDGSVTDERRSLKPKGPQPVWVEAEIARHRGNAFVDRHNTVSTTT